MTGKLRVGVLALALVTSSCAGPSGRIDREMPYGDRLRLASIYIQSGKADRAVPLLEDAVTQEPGRPEAHAMLGEVLFLAGDLEGSARSLARALEAGGDDPVILNNLAWVEMERGDPAEALALVERALRSDPSPTYPFLDTRARALGALGRCEEALRDAKAARKMVPDHDAGMIAGLDELIGDLERQCPGAGYY